jgi:hypothetical protein
VTGDETGGLPGQERASHDRVGLLGVEVVVLTTVGASVAPTR